MPTYLRSFYFNQLIKVKKEENEEQKKAQQKVKRPQQSRFK